MWSTNWKGYRTAAWIGQALLVIAIAVVLIKGQWLPAAALALLVQAAFVLGSLALVRFAFTGTVILAGRVQSDPVVETITRPLGWAGRTADSFSRAASFCSALFDAIPSHWLYIGTALAITLYIAAVALGATAYRTLYANK